MFQELAFDKVSANGATSIPRFYKKSDRPHLILEGPGHQTVDTRSSFGLLLTIFKLAIWKVGGIKIEHTCGSQFFSNCLHKW